MGAPYPPIEPFDEGFLEVADGNRLHWQVRGSAGGRPSCCTAGRAPGAPPGCAAGSTRWPTASSRSTSATAGGAPVGRGSALDAFLPDGALLDQRAGPARRRPRRPRARPAGISGPVDGTWEFSRRWPDSELVIVEGGTAVRA